ncbi:MAG TPA: peptide deformylase [Bacillota bacterium]|nr:peptide deformylase [Bacillota bacterium]
MDQYEFTEADTARFAEEIKNGMVPLSDPCLMERAKPVSRTQITTPEIKNIIDTMFRIAQGQRRGSITKRRRRTLVGLAAPQIGTPLRIVLVDTKVTEDRKKYSKLECFINPVIVWRSRETGEGREGCFSTGPVWGLVRRPLAVKIRALDIHGNEVERIFENFTARITQHEIDHLEGVRFPERIASDRKRHWVHTEELADYPERIKSWPRTCSLERWQALISETEV